MIIAGIYVWALTATGTSQLARVIVWRESDVDDLYRFPSRPVHASSEPVYFTPVDQSPADEVKIFAEMKIDGTIPLDTFLTDTHTTAFIAIHGDNLLYEGYFNGASRHTIQTSFSVAKSFTSTLVGIAIAEGYIASLDEPVTNYIPELLENDPQFENITLRHLITMASGLRYRSWLSPWEDPATTYYAPDLRAAALRSEIVEPPGTTFRYNNYNPQLIGMVLERATEMSVSEYLETRLWQPMGAEADGSWSLDSERSGFEKMESGLNGRAIDFAKFGWIFMRNGRNGDRQVVPSAWIEEATRADITTDPAIEYQYFWWVDEPRNAYIAEGHLCQFIYIYPDADLVLVRMGRDCGGVYWTGLLGEIAEGVGRQLIE